MEARVNECVYLAGRGPQGMSTLREIIEPALALGATWPHRVTLQSAVMGGHVNTLRYLVDVVHVETVNEAVHGMLPLHMAVIWGQIECAAFLLTHGADPKVCDAEGQTAARAARVRQGRLLSKMFKDRQDTSDSVMIGKNDIQRLCEEGQTLIDLLDSVERFGCYRDWLRHGAHPCAFRFLPRLPGWQARRQLAVLRALVLAGRAKMRTTAETRCVDVVEQSMSCAGTQDLRDLLQNPATEAARARCQESAFKTSWCGRARGLDILFNADFPDGAFVLTAMFVF